MLCFYVALLYANLHFLMLQIINVHDLYTIFSNIYIQKETKTGKYTT